MKALRRLSTPFDKMLGGSGAAKVQKHATGAEVTAKAPGWKKFYKGKVTGFDAKDGTYAVEFEDGDKKDGIKGFNVKAVAAKVELVAPDGTKFDDRRKYRQYMSEQYYSVKNKSDEATPFTKSAGDIGGQSFNVANLSKCKVHLMDHSDQVLVDGVEECEILIGPSSDSVFVRNAKNCHFYIACKQFRCRDCNGCTVSLYSKTEPVVETSSNMRFYPYSAAYPGQAAHFEKSNLPAEHNHWCNVFDFNKGDASIPEPHWSLVPEEEGWPKLKLGGEAAENPVPPTARAVVVPKESGFAIQTSQADAQKAYEEEQQAQVVAAPVAPPPVADPTPAATAPAPAAPAEPAVKENQDAERTEDAATVASSVEKVGKQLQSSLVVSEQATTAT